jgi:hypothetical protein
MSYFEHKVFTVSEISRKESALKLCLDIEGYKGWKLVSISQLRNDEAVIVLERKTSWFHKLFRS